MEAGETAQWRRALTAWDGDPSSDQSWVWQLMSVDRLLMSIDRPLMSVASVLRLDGDEDYWDLLANLAENPARRAELGAVGAKDAAELVECLPRMPSV